MTKIDFGAFEKKALMRCSVYSFLSNVFLNEPTKQFARILKQGQLFQRITEFVNIQADFKSFEKYLKENEPQKDLLIFQSRHMQPARLNNLPTSLLYNHIRILQLQCNFM